VGKAQHQELSSQNPRPLESSTRTRNGGVSGGAGEKPRGALKWAGELENKSEGQEEFFTRKKTFLERDFPVCRNSGRFGTAWKGQGRKSSGEEEKSRAGREIQHAPGGLGSRPLLCWKRNRLQRVVHPGEEKEERKSSRQTFAPASGKTVFGLRRRKGRSAPAPQEEG